LGVSINGDLRMKKSLIALAALATVATAAQAQSSVTIYGVIDNGITRATNVEGTNTSMTGMSNGGLSTPRWGFKGVEDLGGGLKAGFNLESELLTDTGAATATLFNRASFLSLSQAGVGSLRMGHMNRQDYSMAAKYDAFGGNNIGGWIASNSGTVSLSVAERISNAVELQTASFGGFKLTYQLGYGEVAGQSNQNRTTVIGAEYGVGKFSTAVTYAEKNANTTAALTTKVTSVYAQYNLGVALLTGGFAKSETDNSAVELSGYHVGARVPVNKKVTVLAAYNAFDNDEGKKPTTYALGTTYAFSKRTTGYLIGAKSNQDNGSKQNIVSTSKYNGFDTPAAGNNQTAYSVGIRHTF
jgi:predicted porin